MCILLQYNTVMSHKTQNRIHIIKLIRALHEHDKKPYSSWRIDFHFAYRWHSIAWVFFFFFFTKE